MQPQQFPPLSLYLYHIYFSHESVKLIRDVLELEFCCPHPDCDLCETSDIPKYGCNCLVTCSFSFSKILDVANIER